MAMSSSITGGIPSCGTSSSASGTVNLATSGTAGTFYHSIQPNYGTISISDYCYSNSADIVYFQFIIDYLNETEIEDIINKLIERSISGDDNNLLKDVLNKIVSLRHFSEDFLIKFLDKLTVRSLMEQHSANIKSGEYSQIALYIETVKNGN